MKLKGRNIFQYKYLTINQYKHLAINQYKYLSNLNHNKLPSLICSISLVCSSRMVCLTFSFSSNSELIYFYYYYAALLRPLFLFLLKLNPYSFSNTFFINTAISYFTYFASYNYEKINSYLFHKFI